MARKPHFQIRVQAEFSGAHHLRGYRGDCEKPHGHNWTVEVFVECAELDETGIGIDFYDVKDALQSVLEELDHNDLNTLKQFQSKNPTSENVAAYLYGELTRRLNRGKVRVTKVGVNETRNFGVLYRED